MNICMNCGRRHGGEMSCLDNALLLAAALTTQRDRLAAAVHELVDAVYSVQDWKGTPVEDCLHDVLTKLRS